MSSIGETFSGILSRWEQQVKIGARTLKEYEQALAVYLPEWKEQDPLSYRESRWYTEYGSAAGYGAPRSFEQLTSREKARALYTRFMGDMRAIQGAITELNLPVSDMIALQNDVRFVDQSEVFSPLAKQVMNTNVRRLPEGQVFNSQTVFDPDLARSLRDPASGRLYGSRREGARQVSDLEASVRASQGAIVTGTGPEARVAMVKGAKDPTDPANINRELKTLYGQSGFQSKVFIRRPGSDTLEPVYAESIARDAGGAQSFRPDYVQDVAFAVVNKRFREEGQAFTVGERYEAVLREFKFLPGIQPGQVWQQTILGARKQIELAPGIVHDTDDYTRTSILVHSSDSTGTWVRIDRGLPLEGGTRYDAGGGKILMGGHARPESLGLPADFNERVPAHLKPQFVADFSTVSKNVNARWYAEIVSEINRKGRPWLEKHGYHDAYDSQTGQIRWERLLEKDHEFEYSPVDQPDKVIRGGLTRFQVLAMDINDDPERWPDFGEGRGSVFLAREAGSYTRSGAYSWHKPRRNIESLARIAERDPKLYQQMIYESRPRQLMYAEVVNTAAMNAGYHGVLNTATEHVRDEQNNIIGEKDRVVTLTPQLAAEIMARARLEAKGGEVGYGHFAIGTESVLSAHGFNPTSRLAFQARGDEGDRQTFYLTGARTNSYFSGPHWQHDMKSLLDPDEVPDALKNMQSVLSKFGRSQIDIVNTLAQNLAVSDGQLARMLSGENDLVGGHDFHRGMTGFTARHSWGGPIVGDMGMALNQIAAPDSVLTEMFPELAAHPEALNQLKFLIDNNDVVATGTREPSPARLQQFYKLKFVTLHSVRDHLTIQDTSRLIVHPATIGQATGDFDGDGFTTLIRSRIRWNGTTKSFELRGALSSASLIEMSDQAKELEGRTWEWDKGEKIGLVGMQEQSYRDDMAKIDKYGGDMHALQKAQILGIGEQGSYSISQMLGGMGWMRYSKEKLGKAYNMGRGWRGLSGDDERFADLMAKLDQVYVDAGKESTGLQRFMENMEGYQPATGYVKRGGPGQKAKFTRFSTSSLAAFDTIAAFMQIDELGNSDFVAQLLWPDESDPDKDTKRQKLIEIRENKDWDRLKEVFGDDPWSQAASLSPILAMFRSKSTGRWERRLNREREHPQGTTPLRPMGPLDELWAALEHGQSAMVSVASSSFHANRDPNLTEQQQLFATLAPMLGKYGAAAGDEGTARIVREVLAPMLGLMDNQTHQVNELVTQIRDQTAVLHKGARVHAATGGSFMVPPGFDNDDYTIGVKSGEKVTVETPAQVAARELRFRGRGTDAMRHFDTGTTPPVGSSLPGEDTGRVEGGVFGSGMGNNLVAALLHLFNKDKKTAETEYGRRVHGQMKGLADTQLAAAKAMPMQPDLRYSFGEVGLRGNLANGAGPGEDISATGTADLIQLFQNVSGDWKYEISDYKTEMQEREHGAQLQLYRWMIENGTFVGEQGEVLRNFMEAHGLTFGNEEGKQQVTFAGANVVRSNPRPAGSAKPDEATMVRELAANQRTARGGQLEGEFAPENAEEAIRGQYAVNQKAKGLIARARNRYNSLINRGSGAKDTQNIAADMESGSYGRQLRGMGNIVAGMAGGNAETMGEAPGGGGRAGGARGGGIFGLGEYSLESGTSAAAFGRGLSEWAQGGKLDLSTMFGDFPNTAFRPGVMDAVIHADSMRTGGSARLSYDQRLRSAGIINQFMQQNMGNMPDEVKALWKGKTQDENGVVSPAGPLHSFMANLAQTSNATGGGVKLAATASGEFTTDIDAISGGTGASAEIKAVVSSFKAIVAAAKPLNDSLTALHASTTDVNKAMNGAQKRYEAAAEKELRHMGGALTTLRNVAERGQRPAAGTPEAEELQAVELATPEMLTSATKLGGAGAPPGGFKGFLLSMLGAGGEGGTSMGGVGGRLAQGNQLLTGVQALYMARLDRMLIEPALRDVSLLSQQQQQGATALAQTGGISYQATPTMRFASQYQAGQQRWQQQAGVTWGTALADLSNMGASYGGAASIAGPALGAGAMGAYVAGQALQGSSLTTTLGGLLPEAAALPIGLPVSLAVGSVLAGGMVAAGLSSRQRGLDADPSQAQMLSLQALGSANISPAQGFGPRMSQVGNVLGRALPEALSRGWGAAINEAGDQWGRHGFSGWPTIGIAAAQKGMEAIQQMYPQAAQARSLLDRIQGGMTQSQWQALSPTEQQTALSMQVYGMPDEGYAGVMSQYGVTAPVASQAVTDSLTYGIGQMQAVRGAAAGVNAGATAAAFQGQYGGSLQSAGLSAAQYNDNVPQLGQIVDGMGTASNQALKAAGVQLSPQELLRTKQVLPHVTQRAADMIGQAYSIKQQILLAGGNTGLIDRLITGSLRRVATSPNLSESAAQNILNDTQNQLYQAGQGSQATLGMSGFLQSQAHMGAGAALTMAQGMTTAMGGSLATGTGAGLSQMLQGFASNNPNVVSQVGSIMGNQTMFTAGNGYNVTGMDMVTRQMGGIAGFAGMGIGTSSLYGANGQILPVFAGAAATGGGLGMGNYTPLGVSQGNLGRSYTIGGQTYAWGAGAGTRNAQTGQTEYGIGGMLELQARASDLSYQSSMASAGLTYQSIARERAFQTGTGIQNYSNYYSTGTPLPWAQGSTNATAQPFQAGQGMWYWQDQSTALGRRQQQYGYEYQGQQLALQASQFGQTQALNVSQFGETQQFNRAQSALSFTRNVQDLSLNRTVQLQQRGYQVQDFAYERGNEQRNYGWQQEDIDFNLRFATGRDRIVLERQKKRSTITHDVEEGHIDTLESRQKTQWKNEDTRYQIEVSRNAQDFKIRTQQYDLEEKHFNESLALTKAQFTESQKLQEENRQRQFDFTKEQWGYEDKLIQLQRASWDENLQAQAKAAGLQAYYAGQQKKIADKEMEIQIAQQASTAQIGVWFDTEYTMMTTFVSHMQVIIDWLNSGGTGTPTLSHPKSPDDRSRNAAGFSGLVSHQSLISVAEQGPEYVSVMPFGRPGFGYAASTAPGQAGGAAMPGQGSTQVVVYIDGEQVSARVERRLTRSLTGAIRR